MSETTEIEQEKIQLQTPSTETNANQPESPHHDSEYDTADTAEDDSSDLDALDDDDDDDDESDVDGSIVLDLERQDGDGQEEDGEKKKVDDDEDRSNPQYIPKKGTFYEHDDRTADEPQVEQKPGGEEPEEKKSPTPSPIPGEKPGMKKWQSAKAMERWSHDRFDVGDQAPKSRAELVSAYGYDIRSEEGPPRARRRRRYGRGPNKYTRKWEDGDAYGKTLQRKLRPEDFPALGSRNSKRNPDDENDEDDEDFKENQSDEQINQRSQPEENNRRSQNYEENRRSQNYEENRRSQPQHQNNDENRENIRRTQNHNEEFKERRSYNQNDDSRPQNRFNDSKTSNRDRNNRFNSGRNTLEFKNQNRGKPDSRNHNQYRENTDRQFDDAPMESMSFTNTKINSNRSSNDARYSNGFDQSENYNKNNNRNSRERDRPSNTTNRTQGLSRNQNQNVPVVNNSKPILNQQQQQPQQQQQQQQPTAQPLPKNISEVSRSNNESSRPKRYSSLRQKSGNEGSNSSQQQPQQQHHVHDPNQEKNILLQLQQSQEKQIYQQQSKYPPIHELIPGNSQNPQILSQQQQQHSVVQGVQNPTQQYQSNFYGQPGGTNQEYAAQAVQQPTVVQSTAQNPQLIAVTQYPAAQYTQAQGAYMQPPPTTAYLPQQQQPTPPQTQILNYVPQITPVTPQAQFQAPYPGYQNYTPVVQTVQPLPQQQQQQQQPLPIQQPIQPIPQIQPLVAPAAPVAGNPASLFQPSGITYYAPQTQIPPRPILAHKRPTNAIPILAPPERGGKGRGRLSNVQFEDYDDETKPVDSADSIDHILDNMFVQRAPYQPPARKSPSPAVENSCVDAAVVVVENSDKEIAGIGEAVQNLVIKDEIPTAVLPDKSNENINQQDVSQETTYRPEVIAGDQG